MCPIQTQPGMLRGVSEPAIKNTFWSPLPYALIMIAFTLLLMVWPQLVTWLPAHM